MIFFSSVSRPAHVLTGIILHEPMYYVGRYIHQLGRRRNVTPLPHFSFLPSTAPILLIALPCLHHQYTIILIHKPYTVPQFPSSIHSPFTSRFLPVPLPPLQPKTHAHTHTRTSEKGGHGRTQLTPAMSHPRYLLFRCLPARPACPFCFKKYKKQTLLLLLTSHHHSHTHTHSSSSFFLFSSQRFSLLVVPKSRHGREAVI